MLGFDLQNLAALYEVVLEDLVAARAAIEVDLDGRTIAAGSVQMGLESDEVDAVLGRYLAVIRELRGSTPRGFVQIRDDDMETLAEVLAVDEHDIGHRLAILMGCDDAAATRAWNMVRNRVVVQGTFGLLIGALAVAGLSASRASADTGSKADRTPIVAPTTAVSAAPAGSTTSPPPPATPSTTSTPSTVTTAAAPDPAGASPAPTSPTIRPADVTPPAAEPAAVAPTEIGTAMTMEKLPDGTIVTEEG